MYRAPRRVVPYSGRHKEPVHTEPEPAVDIVVPRIDNDRGEEVTVRVVRTEAAPARVEPETAPTEEKNVLARTTERLDAAGLAVFGDAFTEARAQAATDAHEMLDPSDVPLEARELIATLEGEGRDELQMLIENAIRLRVQIAEKGMRTLEGTLYFITDGVPKLARTGLEFLDLDTLAKAYAALLEIVPTMALWYAIFGKRVAFKEDGGVLKEPYLKDIDNKDRMLYLVGSIFLLGHVWSGMRHALNNKNFWMLLEKKGIVTAAHALLPTLGQLVGPTVARAQSYTIEKLKKDRTKPE